jgi:DNA polymerase-3 subunit epsilon
MARQRYPGAPASLDALCRRFTVDTSDRVNHGARIDCSLLAAVYLELIGGRQPGLDFVVPTSANAAAIRVARPPRPHAASVEELAAHQALLALLTAPLWLADT